MTNISDVRPPGLNLKFRPGTTITFTITGWAAGSLAGRTFEAKLGVDTLVLNIVGDVMTIVVDDTITDNYPSSVVNFFLNESIGGTFEPLIIGRWTPSTDARETVSPAQTFQVAVGAVTVSVGVSGDAAIAGHTQAQVDDVAGVHGVIKHQWSDLGWTPFTQVTINTDGAATPYTKSVNNKRGRFSGNGGGTATAPGPGGNFREFNVHSDTNWEDSEIRSLWWGPNFFSMAGQSPTRRPQMGHVHRYQVGVDGRRRAYVAWYNIFLGPNPEAINLNVWESNNPVDGTLLQANGGTGGNIGAVTRAGLIGYSTRIDAFDVAQHRVSPFYAASIPIGAVGSIAGMTDTTFNDPAAVTISSGSRTSGVVTVNTSTAHGLATGDWVVIDAGDNLYDGLYQVTVIDSDTFTYSQQAADDADINGGTVTKRFTVNASSPADALVGVTDRVANNNTDKTAGGFWTPEYPWRVFPYWVASRLIGPTLTVKTWAYGMTEPDWGDPLVAASVTPTLGGGATVTVLPTGKGLCGVVGAHAHDSDYAEYGDMEFRKL